MTMKKIKLLANYEMIIKSRVTSWRL